ncbi:MAG: rod shape-determining protein MreC [Flavobacteriales bacterium]|jgi:rod shape-determining protein MreC|nr:rod shape-determining protein MreC [Flavobacteriales bacterium]MBP9159204.1 rod shape-determining protein MreC [Flavobacteriales bacterium]
MRELFRFLIRQSNLLLFLLLMGISLSLLVNGSMHHRAQAISSSNAMVGQLYAWRNEVTGFTDLRRVNRELAVALAVEREKKYAEPLRADSGVVQIDSAGRESFTYITAQVVNSTVQKERNYITLGSGSLDGIRRDMGVIGVNGLVGVVRETSPHFALVTSILGNELAPSVELKRTGHFGLLKWDTSDPATASLTDVANHVQVAPGDTVVTRGDDGVFPRGVPVGTVLSVEEDPGSNFHKITVKLGEDLARTAYVHVVSDLMKTERDTLEAKAPLP